MKQPFAIDLRNNKLTEADLLSLVEAIYPDPDKPDSNQINDAAVVLMSAALIGTTNTSRLDQFTSYGRTFISAIKFNMENSHLWSDGQYDASAWLSSKGAIDHVRLFDDVEVAMGWAWTPEADSLDSIDPCGGTKANTLRSPQSMRKGEKSARKLRR